MPHHDSLVVDATSIGLHPHRDDPVPLDLNSLETDMVVRDVFPNPPETRLLRQAATRGCTAVNGLGMLVNQGIIGIRLWSGLEANPRVIRQALEAVLIWRANSPPESAQQPTLNPLTHDRHQCYFGFPFLQRIP